MTYGDSTVVPKRKERDAFGAAAAPECRALDVRGRAALEPHEARAALRRWTAGVFDEDSRADGIDGSENDPPERPAIDELACEARAKPLGNKAVNRLLADGGIEKLDGQPPRYETTGD